MEKDYVLWDYNNVQKIHNEASKAQRNAKLMLQHYIYQHSDTHVQKNIVPLVCESFINLYNFLKYLDGLMEKENITKDKDGKKGVMVYKNELQILKFMSTTNLLCENDLSNYNISLKEH